MMTRTAKLLLALAFAPLIVGLIFTLVVIASLKNELKQLHAHYETPTVTASAAAPNLHAAIGHALLAASDIAGRDQVVQFFRDSTGEIVAKHAPLDIGGKIKSKCEDDMAANINLLMDNP